MDTSMTGAGLRADPTTSNADPTATGSGTVGGIAAGIWDLIRGIHGTAINNGQTAAGYADPFGPQRAQYQTQLSDLLKNPNSFQADPGYQFALDQGLQGVANHGNAMFGTTRAGNTAIGLDQYATGFANQAYDTRIQELSQLSGANNMFGPSEAGRIMAGAYQNQQGDIAGGLQGGLNGLLNALFGRGGSSIGGAASGISGLLSHMFGNGGGSSDGSNGSFQIPGGIDALFGPTGGTGGNGIPDFSSLTGGNLNLGGSSGFDLGGVSNVLGDGSGGMTASGNGLDLTSLFGPGGNASNFDFGSLFGP